MLNRRRKARAPMRILSKIEMWLDIVRDLGLHTPMYVNDQPRKEHSGGRRENRREPRELAPGLYLQTKRGYLVRNRNGKTGQPGQEGQLLGQ